MRCALSKSRKPTSQRSGPSFWQIQLEEEEKQNANWRKLALWHAKEAVRMLEQLGFGISRSPTGAQPAAEPASSDPRRNGHGKNCYCEECCEALNAADAAPALPAARKRGGGRWPVAPIKIKQSDIVGHSEFAKHRCEEPSCRLRSKRRRRSETS